MSGTISWTYWSMMFYNHISGILSFDEIIPDKRTGRCFLPWCCDVFIGSGICKRTGLLHPKTEGRIYQCEDETVNLGYLTALAIWEQIHNVLRVNRTILPRWLTTVRIAPVADTTRNIHDTNNMRTVGKRAVISSTGKRSHTTTRGGRAITRIGARRSAQQSSSSWSPTITL